MYSHSRLLPNVTPKRDPSPPTHLHAHVLEGSTGWRRMDTHTLDPTHFPSAGLTSYPFWPPLLSKRGGGGQFPPLSCQI